MPTWHLTLATEGRFAFFPDETTRRAAVRRLARVAADASGRDEPWSSEPP